MQLHNGLSIAASLLLATAGVSGGVPIAQPTTSESPWDFTAEASVAGGYKDNLLHSHINREASAFIETGLSSTISRSAADGTELSLLITGEDTRYPGGRNVRKEQSVIVLANGRQSLAENWSIGLKPRYLYFDQVYDSSITETNLLSQPTKSQQFSISPDVRWEFVQHWFLGLEIPVMRQTFNRADLDHYWEGGPKFSLSYSYGPRSEITLSAWAYERFYDSRNQFDQTGAGVPGTHLRYRMEAIELENVHYFDRARHWRSRTRLEYLRNTDNGSDWFSYHQFLAAAQVRYRSKHWTAELAAKGIYYQYDRQLAGPAFVQKRHRTNLELHARFERYFSQSWKIFAEYSHEQSFSNEILDDYGVNRGLAGVSWEY